MSANIRWLVTVASIAAAAPLTSTAYELAECAGIVQRWGGSSVIVRAASTSFPADSVWRTALQETVDGWNRNPSQMSISLRFGDDSVSFGNFENEIWFTSDDTILDGAPASVLRPVVPDLIRVLRDEIFTADGPTSPLAQGDLVSLMQSEAARVRVTNNTYTGDLDIRTGNFLRAEGVQVLEIGVPTGASNQTMLIVYSPKLYTLKYLANLFGLTSYQILMKFDPTASVDIEIRLGEDWVGKLPNGY